MLWHLGWDPIYFNTWIDTRRFAWTIALVTEHKQVCSHLLVQALQDDASRVMWKEAVLHYNASGIQDGVAYEYTMRTLWKYRKEKINDKAGALETILVGACWSPDRKFQENIIPLEQNVCAKCGESPCNDLHQFWSCPSLADDPDEDIQQTQKLIPRALAEQGQFACFWLRGILPAGLFLKETIPLPVIDTTIRVFDPFGITPNGSWWPPGTYGTDASGGEFSSYPEIRRCGCGISAIRNLTEIEWAASFPLEGEIQTVPRAELFAILTLVQHLQPGSESIVVSDSKVNVDLFRKGKYPAMASTNGDLWQIMFDVLERNQVTIRLHWIQGHLDTVEAKKWFPPIWFALNHAADFFANIAAKSVEVPKNISTIVIYHVHLVAKVQKRLTKIIVTLPYVPREVVELKPPKPKRATLDSLVAESKHTLVDHLHGWQCIKCKSTVFRGAVTIRDFLLSSCTEVVISDADGPERIPPDHPHLVGKHLAHSSHVLYYYRGVTFCAACGCFVSKVMRKLAHVCVPIEERDGWSGPDATRKRQRLRLQACTLPHSLEQWPRPQDSKLRDLTPIPVCV